MEKNNFLPAESSPLAGNFRYAASPRSDVGPRDSRDPGTCSRTSSIDSSNLARRTRRFRMYDVSRRIACNNVHIKSCTRAQRDDSLRFNLWNLLPREWEMANDLAQRFGRRRPIPAESRARAKKGPSLTVSRLLPHRACRLRDRSESAASVLSDFSRPRASLWGSLPACHICL